MNNNAIIIGPYQIIHKSIYKNKTGEIFMKKVLALAMALALAFSLAGCSGTTSGSSLASSEMQEESSQSASAADSTSETPTLDAIREKGVLTMLTATGYPPYNILGMTVSRQGSILT